MHKYFPPLKNSKTLQIMLKSPLTLPAHRNHFPLPLEVTIAISLLHPCGLFSLNIYIHACTSFRFLPPIP